MAETTETLLLAAAITWAMAWPMVAWVRGDDIRLLRKLLKISDEYGQAWRHRAERLQAELNQRQRPRPSDEEIDRAVRNAGATP